MEKKNGLKAMLSDLVTSLRFGDGPLWKERIAYFFTNIGNIPVMTMVNAYLLYYYTDTLGMNPNTVATMALVARVFDGVNDPFIGYFIDKSPNSRFGKFRRTLIIGTVICTLNYAVVWMGPAFVSDAAKIVVAYISYMLLGVTFPVMDISLNSMLPVMTTDMDERNVLASIKNFAYGVGGGALGLFVPVLLGAFNSSVKGYNVTNLIVMAIILSCSIGGIMGVRQKIEPSAQSGYKAADVFKVFKTMPVVASFVGGLIIQTGMAFIGTANAYYATHALGSVGKLSLINLVPIIGTPITLLAIPAAKRIGKRRVYFYGILVAGLGCFVRLVAVNTGVSGLAAACVSSLIYNTGVGFAQLLFYSVQADNIDYIDYKLGFRAEGIIAAITSMITKVSNGIGGAFTLYVLSWTANPDSSYSKFGLVLSDGIIPGTAIIVGGIIFFALYKIENKDVEMIQAELSRRREAAQNEA